MGRRARASAWSTRPRSSPRRASWRATRSSTAAAATVQLEALNDGDAAGLRLDVRGPGPGHRGHRARRCKDGYTTGSGLGLGLGGAKRLSNEFEIDVAARARARASRSPDGNDAQRVVFAIDDASQVGEARRDARRARRAGSGFDEADAGARRARRHRGGDQPREARAAAASSLLCGARRRAARAASSMLALDRGPGMRDVAACLRDGYLDRRHAGHRARRDRAAVDDVRHLLAAAARHGRVRARSGRTTPRAARRRRRDRRRLRRRIPARRCAATPGPSMPMATDALHGRWSSTASATALDAAEAAARRDASSSARTPDARARGHDRACCTTALRARAARRLPSPTIDLAQRGPCASPASATSPACVRRRRREPASMVSHHGTLGHRRATIQEFQYPWPERRARSCCTPTASSTRWTLDRLSGARAAAIPTLIAARALPRLHAAARDDVTVVVAARGAHERRRCSRSPIAHEHGRRARAPARAPDRRAARLRRAGPDAHRDRRVRDRAQRVPLRRRRHASSSRIEGATPPQVLLDRASTDEGPGIADLDGDPRRPLPLDDRHGARHRRRARLMDQLRRSTSSADGHRPSR